MDTKENLGNKSNELAEEVVTKSLKEAVSLYQLIDRESFLSTGCPKFDFFLRGGFSRRGITQIYGEAGTGKTQLALQLCLSAQIPSKDSNETYGAIYIGTESLFPAKRLQELLKKFPEAKKYPVSSDLIRVIHISTIDEFEDCIINKPRLSNLLATRRIKLLVIDTIAAPFRAEYDSEALKDRAKLLRNIGYQLQKFSSLYGVAVICLNQVSALMGPSTIEHLSSKEQPALGVTWACMVTNSFYIYKRLNRRFLTVAGSSYLPCKTISFEITDCGIVVDSSK